MNSLKHETITYDLSEQDMTRKKNKSHDIVRNMALVCVIIHNRQQIFFK